MPAKKRRSAPQQSSLPQLSDALLEAIIEQLFRFGRRPVVTALVCRRLRACTNAVAARNLECDAEQLALFNVMTNPKGGSIMCVVKDAVRLSIPKIKAYAHSQAARRPRGYYLVFPNASVSRMIFDNGGFDGLETRRLKKIAAKQKRAGNARQRVSSREAELDAALGAQGVQRRNDSRLCDEFLGGRSALSAANVAAVMARMKYFHEYCQEFIDKVAQAEAEVEDEVERTAEENRQCGRHEDGECDERGYYRGIHAECMREVTGTCSWAEFKDDLMAKYALPSKWPWLP